MSLTVRPATIADVPGITAIYTDAVLHGTATFDLEPPAEADLERRLLDLQAGGYPYLVAERQKQVVGYAYAAPFRLRAAYASTVEDSVYIAPEERGRGVGKFLLERLITACEELDFRTMWALIGDSASVASISLHRSVGFTPVGTFAGSGHKFGRWIDVVLMERVLGPGTRTPPTR